MTKIHKLKLSLPTWIDADVFINKILLLEGQELYNTFGFNDSTSCTKFLSKFIPGKPKNMRFSKYLASLLENDIEVDLDLDVDVETKTTAISFKSILKSKNTINID